jgi:hypothetical protein
VGSRAGRDTPSRSLRRARTISGRVCPRRLSAYPRPFAVHLSVPTRTQDQNRRVRRAPAAVVRSRSTTALIGWTRLKAADPTKSLRWHACRSQHVVSPRAVLTIGHSTRSIDEFLRLLTAHGVDRVIDIAQLHGRDTTRSSAVTRCAGPCVARGSDTRTSAASVDCDTREGTRQTRVGETRASAGMPTTCRLRRSEDLWIGVSISRRPHMSCSCARRPFRGAAIARSSRMPLSSEGSP